MRAKTCCLRGRLEARSLCSWWWGRNRYRVIALLGGVCGKQLPQTTIVRRQHLEATGRRNRNATKTSPLKPECKGPAWDLRLNWDKTHLTWSYQELSTRVTSNSYGQPGKASEPGERLSDACMRGQWQAKGGTGTPENLTLSPYPEHKGTIAYPPLMEFEAYGPWDYE